MSRQLQNIKKILKKTGLFKSSGKKGYIQSSSEYWDKRYVNNKTSGAGSYGRLAEFKAEIINDFVKSNQVQTIIEFGSGDGNQLQLANYKKYVGFDVSEKAIAMCNAMFEEDDSKSFYLMDDESQIDTRAQLTMSLDVIYHLIEDVVFNNYMSRLFNASEQYVIIYSSNYDGFLARHVKSRKFTDWISEHLSDSWVLKQTIKNRYPFDQNDPENTSISDFYIYEKIISKQE